MVISKIECQENHKQGFMSYHICCDYKLNVFVEWFCQYVFSGFHHVRSYKACIIVIVLHSCKQCEDIAPKSVTKMITL